MDPKQSYCNFSKLCCHGHRMIHDEHRKWRLCPMHRRAKKIRDLVLLCPQQWESLQI